MHSFVQEARKGHHLQPINCKEKGKGEGKGEGDGSAQKRHKRHSSQSHCTGYWVLIQTDYDTCKTLEI
jgi:hypothetical protein